MLEFWVETRRLTPSVCSLGTVKLAECSFSSLPRIIKCCRDADGTRYISLLPFTRLRRRHLEFCYGYQYIFSDSHNLQFILCGAMAARMSSWLDPGMVGRAAFL